MEFVDFIHYRVQYVLQNLLAILIKIILNYDVNT
jgi:hypothetical protein